MLEHLSGWLGPYVTPREGVLWSRSDMQRAGVLDTKIIKLLSLLIGPVDLQAQQFHPFQTQSQLEHRNNHVTVLLRSWDTWQALFIPSHDAIGTHLSGLHLHPCWVELSWKHAQHLLVHFCKVCRKHTWMVKWASIWNWPSHWVSHCHYTTEMWVLEAAGHLMLLSHLICSLRSTPLVDFISIFGFIVLFGLLLSNFQVYQILQEKLCSLAQTDTCCCTLVPHADIFLGGGWDGVL